MSAGPARRVGRRPAVPARDDSGFTLLEVMVSFVLFSVVAASATRAIVVSLQASHSTQQAVEAANVAQSFIASQQVNTILVRAEPLVVGGPPGVYAASVNNEEFVVTRTIIFTPARATQCTPGVMFTVDVSVTQKQSGKFLARSDAVVTC